MLSLLAASMFPIKLVGEQSLTPTYPHHFHGWGTVYGFWFLFRKKKSVYSRRAAALTKGLSLSHLRRDER